MNHSFYSADRETHRRVIILALVSATIVAGIVVLPGNSIVTQTARMEGPRTIKATKAHAFTSSEPAIVQ